MTTLTGILAQAADGHPPQLGADPTGRSAETLLGDRAAPR